jgi:hypothetical protein
MYEYLVHYKYGGGFGRCPIESKNKVDLFSDIECIEIMISDSLGKKCIVVNIVLLGEKKSKFSIICGFIGKTIVGVTSGLYILAYFTGKGNGDGNYTYLFWVLVLFLILMKE